MLKLYFSAIKTIVSNKKSIALLLSVKLDDLFYSKVYFFPRSKRHYVKLIMRKRLNPRRPQPAKNQITIKIAISERYATKKNYTSSAKKK